MATIETPDIQTNFLYKNLKDELDSYAKNNKNNKQYSSYELQMLKNLNLDQLDGKFSPFINGYYYIHMVSGTWIDYFKPNPKNKDSKNKASGVVTTGVEYNDLKEIASNMGSYIFGSDLPNILMETEVVSGRLRNINYATKTQINSDFSINYHDDNNLSILKYYTSWFKYIELLRRGEIEYDSSFSATSSFMDIPYYNAIFVIIFKPLSIKPIAIFKILGVMPINLPQQTLLGDRSSPSIGIFNQNLKCNDVIFDIQQPGKKLETDTIEKPSNLFEYLYSDFLNKFGLPTTH